MDIWKDPKKENLFPLISLLCIKIKIRHFKIILSMFNKQTLLGKLLEVYNALLHINTNVVIIYSYKNLK